MILNFLKATGVSVVLFCIIRAVNKLLIITEIKSVDYIEFPIWGYYNECAFFQDK